MKTFALLSTLASVALCQNCPGFSGFGASTLYANETDNLGPIESGNHTYLATYIDLSTPVYGQFRLTNDSTGNLVSDAYTNSYNADFYVKPINFSEPNPAGHFLHLQKRTTAPDYEGHYNFTCDQYGGFGGEGLLTVQNAPAGMNQTKFWFCPMPGNENAMAIKFGVQEDSVPEGCDWVLVQGVQD